MWVGLGRRQIEGFPNRELTSSARGSEVVHGPVTMRVTRAGQGKTQSTKHGAGYNLKLGEGKSGECNEYYPARDAVWMGNVSCMKNSSSVEHEGLRDGYYDSRESLTLEVLKGLAERVMQPYSITVT